MTGKAAEAKIRVGPEGYIAVVPQVVPYTTRGHITYDHIRSHTITYDIHQYSTSSGFIIRSLWLEYSLKKNQHSFPITFAASTIFSWLFGVRKTAAVMHQDSSWTPPPRFTEAVSPRDVPTPAGLRPRLVWKHSRWLLWSAERCTHEGVLYYAYTFIPRYTQTYEYICYNMFCSLGGACDTTSKWTRDDHVPFYMTGKGLQVVGDWALARLYWREQLLMVGRWNEWWYFIFGESSNSAIYDGFQLCTPRIVHRLG